MERNEYITDEQVVKRAKAAVRLAIEKKKILGLPIVAYDSGNNEIYQINEGGGRIFLGKGIGGGRYSERVRANKEIRVE